MPLTDKLIWTIETRLSSELNLAELATECRVTPHHLGRVFVGVTGMSVMTYIRRRRLSQAAIELQAGSPDILQLALECGYGSHEAFTRAFSACFGVLPSALRRHPSDYSLSLTKEIQVNRDMIMPLAEPVIKQRGAFSVVGLMLDSAEGMGSIPALWTEFNAQRSAFNEGEQSYGICLPAAEPGNFRYLAGTCSATVPAGMTRVDLPAGNYAVFTHVGHIADLPKSAFTAWNKVLPELSLQPREAPDFELYDERFDPQTGLGEVELWIPLADDPA